MSDKNLPAKAARHGDLLMVEGIALPAIVLAAGEEAAHHFLNYFIASIRNRHTRRAYARQARTFLEWCQGRGAEDIRQLQTHHAAAYIELLTRRDDLETASVKQALSALRHLFDWLTVHQVVKQNPFTAVRGPKLVVEEGRTPCWDGEMVAALFESIDTEKLIGLRDRALIAVMAYSFARIGATTALNVDDYRQEGKDAVLELREKGGKRKSMVVHHMLEKYLDEYIAAAGISEEKGTPLFRSADGKTGKLRATRLSQDNAWRMLQRRARAAGIEASITNHTWRATGITNFLENGGALEMAQYMAGHADPRTTRLYDRRKRLITRSEVERIRYEKKKAQP